MTRKEWIENIVVAGALLLFLSLEGCTASQSLGSTAATVVLKDGTTISWNNNKDINFKATFDGKAEQFNFEGQSSTPEAAMANVAASQAAMAAALAKIIDTLGPLIPAAAKIAATTGS